MGNDFFKEMEERLAAMDKTAEEMHILLYGEPIPKKPCVVIPFKQKEKSPTSRQED